ncbi:hypothetical protein K469DRAFT_706409 [Zopfia rhizophila CBS 207.26]|uniref:DUF6594 domain-containing protein n=1 Tax=Zopfia rhizophila CBS 207.26 TaxID=1314779 RepID=A0A6A6E3H4_9PEZI|nr:hypothetical protein K469DRAFT_706409 [Zopfia rhizophila CBS 207.26]
MDRPHSTSPSLHAVPLHDLFDKGIIMQNAESAMEKGEAGLPAAEAIFPAPTSPTLCNKSSTDSSTAFPGSLAHCRNASHWSWTKFAFRPSWSLFTKRQYRRKKYRIPVKTRRLNDCPKGYPNLAAFLDSDEGFTMYRRFGYLQSRLLLDKQEELRVLEKKLDRMDKRLTKKDEDRMCSRDMFGSDVEKHRQLLSDIEAKFCSYANILTAAQQMMAFKRPADADYQSVGRYINNRKPLVEEEATWIQHKEDIVTLRTGREHAWLDDVVEGFLKICHCRLIDMLFRSKETRKKTEIDSEIMPARPPKDEDKYEIYYTPSRIAKLTDGILTILVLILLVLPIYLLYHMVHDIGTKKAYVICIGMLLIFTLAFSSVLSLFTKARRHEILAAAAAYCAVLVVFLGNVVPTDGSPK